MFDRLLFTFALLVLLNVFLILNLYYEANCPTPPRYNVSYIRVNCDRNYERRNEDVNRPTGKSEKSKQIIEVLSHYRKYKKQILVYTPFFGKKPWPMVQPMTNYSQLCDCDIQKCDVTYNQSAFTESDLVLFHSQDLNNIKELHRKKPTNQIWLYFSMENPYSIRDIETIDRYFDVTSSYRLSSDIVFPYRYHRRRRPNSKIQPPVNYASEKTRQIAWLVSNCGRPRDRLAEKLFRYGLQIDNFGKCDFHFVYNRPYPESREPPIQKYKFVFAAENRLCKDYVTEKYWHVPFDRDRNTIPIVLGGANYSDPRLAIPGSYIDALSFKSPKDLADHLLAIDRNDTLFNEYFQWKKYWTFYDTDRHPACSLFVCDACEKLWKNNWKFQKKPLSSVISASRECEATERYFNWWIKKES